jgi:hypothetical protein
MRHIKSVAFVFLVVAWSARVGGVAMPPDPPFYYCPDGCTCDTDGNNPASVSGSCPDAAGRHLPVHF